MTQNNTGITLKVTKAQQCRHSERQGFVSYDVTASTAAARCSNCGSESAALPIDWRVFNPVSVAKEAARNALMKIEAEPLT